MNLTDKPHLRKTSVIPHFRNVKLKIDDVKKMISTYEFLIWCNRGEDKKHCQKVLKALIKSLK